MSFATPHADPNRIVPLHERDEWFGAPLSAWLHPRRNKDGSEFDFQRQAVYNAETKAFGVATESFLCDPIDFVDALTHQEDFKRVYGEGWKVLITELPHKRTYATGANNGIRKGRMQIPRWANNPFMLTHELAHCVLPNKVAHGALFAFVYLDLLALTGLDGKLYEEFFEKKIRTTPWE